jgi:hypothetical protein
MGWRGMTAVSASDDALVTALGLAEAKRQLAQPMDPKVGR